MQRVAHKMWLALLVIQIAFIVTLGSPLGYPASNNITTRDIDCDFRLPVHIVHEFPHGTWIESLAIRPNGKILANMLWAPEIYQVDPSSEDTTPVLIHTFPSATSLTGIVELQNDVFYVVTGIFSRDTLESTKGSFSVWKVDFCHPDREDEPEVTKVTDIPDAAFLNGMTVLDHNAGLLLISDSMAGVVWRLNVETGEATIVLDDPLMKIPPGRHGFAVGINGIQVRSNALFFINTGGSALVRLPINQDGTAAGESVIFSDGIIGADDFTFDGAGTAFISQNGANELSFVGGNGGPASVLVGSPYSLKLAGPTACAFGRTPHDYNRMSLYVSTTGGTAAYLSQTYDIGGTISRVDIVAL